MVYLLKPKYVSVSPLPRSKGEFPWIAQWKNQVSASFDFLLELADIFPKLNIVLEREHEASDPVLLRLVQEILSRKCDMLLIDYIQKMETAMSASDVEKLIQVR